MIKGENGHWVVRLTDQPGVAEDINSNTVIFYEPEFEPPVFSVNDEEIAFVPNDFVFGKIDE